MLAECHGPAAKIGQTSRIQIRSPQDRQRHMVNADPLRLNPLKDVTQNPISTIELIRGMYEEKLNVHIDLRFRYHGTTGAHSNEDEIGNDLETQHPER